ncbi:hypothetical protein CONLIGDRAFT_411250 [Coniochaeta ligniaria NRRL 30616]|uniref:Zn(2)-C6 fungal-type domain-containing protein n=1 Tax=Coniochaeta ligniaria NRRL 30616 TaxID=1408157 RepID=A0A1J7JNB3_9PEZI|nr:hypothetical protein CONLIGDRAFT_411250 [Coniochaeta ligniaria NRRL 30616]
MDTMTQSGQVRDACDRCHSIKTRCQRVASDRPVCQRCDRLGLPCSYSPPGQTGRPPGGRKRKETDASTAEDPDRPPQQSSKKPERLGQQGNTINVATGSTIAALLSPESSTILPDNLLLHLTSSETGQHDGTFRIDDFPISPWPYYTPDIISPDDMVVEPRHNNSDINLAYPPLAAQHAPPSSDLHEHPSHLGQQINSTSQHTAPSSPADAIHVQLMQLAELQSRLLVLGKSVAEASDSFSSIEEVLIVSENFISLFQAIEPLCHHLPAKNNRNTTTSQLSSSQQQQQKEAKTSQTAIFLLSNCYLNLIDIFETLVAQLQNEQSFQGSAAQDHRSHPPQQSLVSIGLTRVSMSRQAAAEVHLLLVFCMFDRPASSLGVHGNGTDQSNGGRMHVAQSIVSLAGRAVRSLATLEERVAERRGKAKFVIES